jgi:2-oxo-4-hydroxy-4-carboxy-5-ureidoimidazoline decarboxylase
MSVGDATATLLTVCGSKKWVEAMCAKRPFASGPSMIAEADRIWFSLGRCDWMEAFSHHPRIGERNLSQPKFASTAAQSNKEQSGMAAATEEQKREFAAGNREYENKFGHVFLICATGKTAGEMLAQLRTRLKNDAEAELTNATKEQSMIVRLRLERLVAT